MIKFYLKLKTLLKTPGQYFRYKSKYLRRFYNILSKIFHFRTHYQRRVKNNFLHQNVSDKYLISMDQGFKKFDYQFLSENITNIDLLLSKIKRDLQDINLNNFVDTNDGIINLFSSEKYGCESLEFKFVTNQYLIEIISKYLGCVPLLTHISLWYSPNKKINLESSQSYHLDHEDYRQVKGFLYIDDVDEQCGPLNIINAKQSSKIQNKIQYRLTKKRKRVEDLLINDLKKDMSINEFSMIGKSGDLVLVDTSSCFHFGSRIGTKPRFVLAFQYITPFAFSLDWNWLNSKKLYNEYCKNIENKIQKRIIGKII